MGKAEFWWENGLQHSCPPRESHQVQKTQKDQQACRKDPWDCQKRACQKWDCQKWDCKKYGIRNSSGKFCSSAWVIPKSCPRRISPDKKCLSFISLWVHSSCDLLWKSIIVKNGWWKWSWRSFAERKRRKTKISNLNGRFTCSSDEIAPKSWNHRPCFRRKCGKCR